MRECPECGLISDVDLTCAEDGVALVTVGIDPRVGTVLGSYRLTRRIGRGGMGAVYLGEHPRIGSKVAIKLLHHRYARDPVVVERFFNEARAVNLIGHENIVRISDFATAPDGCPYFVMEHLEGEPLGARVGRPMPLAQAGPVLMQAADGLQAAHDVGIIHRDLKPDNIFLVCERRRSDVVKVLDFGVAKLTRAAPTPLRTLTGVVIGTAHYMAPEQAAGELARIGPGTDIYALGVILFQLSTGRLPFENDSFAGQLVAHMTRPPPQPRAINPDIPEDLERFILRCLAKEPSERPTSMMQFQFELGAVLDGHGLPHEPPAAVRITPPALSPVLMAADVGREPTTLPERRLPSRRTLFSVLGAVVALLVSVFGLLQRRPAEPTPMSVIVPPPPKAQMVRLTVNTDPAGAAVTLRQGSETRRFTAPHEVEVAAGVRLGLVAALPGRRPASANLEPWTDARVDLELPAAEPAPSTAQKAPGVVGNGQEKHPENKAVEPRAAPVRAKQARPSAVGDGMVEIEL
jgi:serine/threonine protein kinase